MSEKKIIAIVGATGQQGGSVANTFLADPSWQVRALTRSASSSKAQALRDKGAEIVEAHLNDLSSLEKAFEGVHVIYGVTDFWAIYRDESMQSRLKPGQTLIQLAFEYELQQGRFIFDAAAKVPTLERLVFSTLANARKLSDGKYTKAYHLDAKALGAEYGKETYPELWAKTSLLQLGFYLNNFLDMPWTEPRKNKETGVYEFTEVALYPTMPLVAADSDTGVLVKALVKAVAGQNLCAFRQRMTMQEYIDLWASFVGAEAKVVEGSLVREDAPPDFAEELTDVFNFCKEFGLFGEKVDKSLVTPLELDPSLQLGTVEDWIKAQDWSRIVKA